MDKRHIGIVAASVLLLMLLSGCSSGTADGVVEVKWDRHNCERCRMVLSDRNHAAQIRITESSGKSRSMLFDDIGCAVIWMHDNPFLNNEQSRVWVADWRTGQWIDARLATYLTGQASPMGYGLGAQSEGTPEGKSFAEATAHIHEVERRFNVHSTYKHSGGAPSIGQAPGGEK